MNNVKGGVGYFVSEKLKSELEAQNVTGISFQDLKRGFKNPTLPITICNQKPSIRKTKKKVNITSQK